MTHHPNSQGFAGRRREMVRQDLMARGITEPGLLKVIGQIPREEFVPEEYHRQAYTDGPLPIGHGQTISQPYIVALMTEQLDVNCHCDVLEIGTGSGYQTAVLAELAKKVYTIEKLAKLSESAQMTLGRMGIRNVEFLIGDGSCGWPEEREFDRIIITAGVPAICEPLKNQLAEGGIISAPVGGSWVQQLVVAEKSKGVLTEKVICDVRFVRLIGKYGFNS